MAGYVDNKDAKKAHGVRTFEPALLLDALVGFGEALDADGAMAQSGDVGHVDRRAADDSSCDQ